MSDSPSLELFVMQRCPFCRRVLAYMRHAGIDIPLRDIDADSSAREELLTKGGKTQVPCLFIDGEALYESEDIVYWLSENVA